MNFAKHKISFEFGIKVFEDPSAIDVDTSQTDQSEVRRKSIGLIEGKLHVVIYTDRNGVCRVISARRANANEHRIYETI